MRLYVQLGRAGDILSILPMLWKDAQSGQRPKLMVAAEFAPLLEGVSYVEPVIYQGPHYELKKAVTQAKASGDEVVSLQVNGPVEQVSAHSYRPAGLEHAVTTSYQKEMWRLAGRLKEWDECYPLVFDKRNPEREAKLLYDCGVTGRPGRKKPLLLVSSNGNSSPFPYTDLMLELVRLRFEREFTIIQLPKAERIFDLLALYEKAYCLISTDSAPLHLARACPGLPVIALTNDKPLLWNGSAWEPNWTWCCRYHDFPERATDMLYAIEHCRDDSDIPFVSVWSNYGKDWPQLNYSRKMLAISPGACGRDSANTVSDLKRVPYLKDCIRMGLQRAKDEEVVCLSRPETRFEIDTPPYYPIGKPGFAYRITRSVIGDMFYPIVDAFIAKKSFWKAHLEEIPDLLLGSDYYWSQALLVIFKRHGAVDMTGICFRNEKPTNPTTPPTPPETPRLAHNLKLAQPFVLNRYPKVTDQVETIPLHREKLMKNGYNCSLADSDSGLLLAYRYHDDGVLSTKLAIARILETGEVVTNTQLQVGGYSVEDPRFFTIQNKTWISWVETYWPLKAVGSVRYGMLKGSEIAVLDRPAYGENDDLHMEKNWVFFEHNQKIYFIYKCSPDQIVVEWSGAREGEHTSPGPRWPYGPIRGGTPPIPYDGKLLRFFHSRLDNEITYPRHRYFIGACLMKPEPPFETLVVSQNPIIYGSEVDDLTPDQRKGCTAYNPNVVFPLGAVQRNGYWLLSLGANHCECVIAKITPKQLNF